VPDPGIATNLTSLPSILTQPNMRAGRRVDYADARATDPVAATDPSSSAGISGHRQY